MTDCPACGHTVHESALGYDASTGATGCKFCSSATRLCADGGRDLDPDELAATIAKRREAAQSSADVANAYDDHDVRRYCDGRVAAYDDVLGMLDADDDTPRIMADGGLAAFREFMGLVYATRAGGEWVSTNGSVVTDDLGGEISPEDSER